LLGGASVVISLLSLAPAALAQSATTAPPQAQATVAKRVFPQPGFEPRPGGIAIFEVSFTLASNANGVIIEDSLTNAGRWPDTAILIPNEPPPIPRSPVLFGPNIFNVLKEQVPFVQTAILPNRIVHQFQLGNLPAGRYLLYYDVLFSDKLRCGTNVVNGANLRVAGQPAPLAVAQPTTFRLRCV
jgi:hypothetical protein